MGTKNSQNFMSILLFSPPNPLLKIVNEMDLYRNPKILKKDEIPMWDYCKIENCLRNDVGKTNFLLDSKCIYFKPSDQNLVSTLVKKHGGMRML